MELAEGDENLIRNDYTELEKVRKYSRRKEIYLQLHPETGQGGSRQSESAEGTEGIKAPRYTEAEKKKTGESERKIQRYVQIGKALKKDVDPLIAQTPVANSQKELFELSQLPEDEQLQVAEAIQRNPDLTVEKARATLKTIVEKEAPTEKGGKPIVTQLPPDPSASAGEKTAKPRKKTEVGPAAPKPEPKSGAGKKATDQHPYVLPSIIKGITDRATQEADHRFVILTPGQEEMLLDGQPENMHLGKVLESSFEKGESEEGSPFGTFLIKVELTEETTAALSVTSAGIIDGYLRFPIARPVSEEKNNSEQKDHNPMESQKARLIGQIGQQTDRIDAQGDIEVECDCGHAIIIPASELKWDEGPAVEREMGPERSYIGQVEWKCPGCKEDINVGATVSEYPPDALNDVDWKVKGGTLVKALDLEIKQD